MFKGKQNGKRTVCAILQIVSIFISIGVLVWIYLINNSKCDSGITCSNPQIWNSFWKVVCISCIFVNIPLLLFIWQNDTKEDNNSKDDKRFKILGCRMIVYSIIIVSLIIFCAVFKINFEQFGIMGDFLGGVLGTIVAGYSVYWIIKTFQKQAESTKLQSESQQLQVFDNLFKTTLDLYQKALPSDYDDVFKKILEGVNNINFSQEQYSARVTPIVKKNFLWYTKTIIFLRYDLDYYIFYLNK